MYGSVSEQSLILQILSEQPPVTGQLKATPIYLSVYRKYCYKDKQKPTYNTAV